MKMMLNSTHKIEDYQRCGGVIKKSLNMDNLSKGLDASASKSERESIHSGQFMVSDFEAEEAQDDLDDGEIKMLDPDDPSLSKADESNLCTEVQRYVPRNVIQSQNDGGNASRMVTSQLEIEISLTKLFKCMNLAYSQKLTSPKWNHFKGVRLTWKDKIRLNNVIWRCWHMQFILKRKTPVCQFASPLDVDIHSNPQSVVLEGKYWKRQLIVIKAEYRKWRRNFKSQAIGSLTYDNKSDLDFLEWSPLNDNNLMLTEDWTSDTLFSSINGPFPFPDQREIARGAVIADFIQPSLGSLQPNLDSPNDYISELLQNNPRLPPVPEEGTDDMLKNVDYGFSSIIGSEQLDSNIMDVGSNNINQLQNDADANMMELNTPINNVPFSDIEQHFVNRSNVTVPLISQNHGRPNNEINSNDTLMQDVRSRVFQTESTATSNRASTKHYVSPVESSLNRQISDFPGKSVIKGRISKSSQRPFRREPHNYDKAQPTLHQTIVYQHVLADQQKTQQHHQHLQPTINPMSLEPQTSVFPTQQQQQHHMQYTPTHFVPTTTTTNLVGTNNNFGFDANPNMNVATMNATQTTINNSLLSIPHNTAGSGAKNFNLIQSTHTSIDVGQSVTTGSSTSAQSIMSNVKVEPSTEVMSMFNMSTPNELYNNSSLINNNSANSYKPYPNIPPFKKSASTGNYMSMRDNSSGMSQTFLQDGIQPGPYMHTHSLPLNFNPTLLSSLHQNMQQQQQQQQLSSLSSSTAPSQQQQQSSLASHLLLQHQTHSQQQHQQSATDTQSAQLVQQQQQQQQTTHHGLMPKEMFRSNSLPLSVTFQKKEPRLNHENFAIPKHQAVKSNGKSRARSNSINQHVPSISNMGSGFSSGSGSSNLQVSSQLQAATSDPMLNSTLAQLLTTNSRMSTLGHNKQQSSSTSAISNLSVPTPVMGASVTTTSQSLGTPSNKKNQNTYLSPTQSSSSSSSLGAVVGSTAQQDLLSQHLQMQQQQQQHHHQQLRKSPKKSTSLPTPSSSAQMIHSPPGTRMMSYPLAASATYAITNSSTQLLSLSPESFQDQDSPLSPTHSLKYPRDNQRRAGHIHAEQKRRYNIKNGFDTLHSLIPQLKLNPNAKLSKAAMLQKAGEHIKHLRTERNQLQDNMELLRAERDTLNNSLMHLHSILPANGAPVTRQGTEHVRQLYEQYVHCRTVNNWKFWILGLILEPLLTSYTGSVSSASMDELRRTAFLWIDQHCSLIDLRPAVSNKLKYLSMKTDILSVPPSTLQEEVAKAIKNNPGQHPNLHGT